MSSDWIVLLLRVVVVAALYLFLVQVLLIVRRDLRTAGPPAPLPSRAPSTRLAVLESGASSLAPGDVIDLTEVNSLGRGPSNSIRLADDSVSTEHALIVRRDRQWWIEDLGSTNGTLVNSTRVVKPAVVVPGDIIVLGRVRLRLEQP